MSVPSMTPHRMAGATEDWLAVDSYARDAIDVGDWLRSRAVPEPVVVTLPAKLLVAAVWVACVGYCILIWVGVA